MARDQWLCHRRHSSSLATKCLFTLLALSSLTVNGASSVSAGNDNEQVSVRGVVGQSASLPCYIDEANCGDIYFLTWSKREPSTDGERWSRIYVYSDDNVNKPLSTLAGRARFEMKNNDRKEPRLVVNALRPGDEALYKCDVTYVAGKCPSLTFVQLQIIAKPLRSWIEHEGESLASGQHLALSENDHLKLQCSVLGGRPVPTIRWFSVDTRGRRTMLKSSQEATPGVELLTSTSSSSGAGDSVTTTSLVLSKQVSRSDLGSLFECGIEHESIDANSLDTSVSLDINVGIKTMKIIGPSTSVREGDRALIECVAYGSKPAAEIVWRNGSKTLDNSRSARTVEEPNTDGITVNTRSSLEIVVSHHDHLNPITCEAANVAMRAPINKSTEISVLFAPQVVMQPSNGIAVNESTPSVSIYCTFNANPSILLINETVWFKDGQVIDFGSPSRDNRLVSTFAEYPILTIQNVSRADTGNYYCSMANQLGAGRPANPVYLNVLYPPRVRLSVHPTPTPGFNIKESDNLRMVCDIVDGNPRRATKMRWLKNGGETVSELDSGAQSQKELTWMSVSRSLTGNYTCQAISEAGLSEPSNSVPIVIDYPPGKAIIRMLDESYAIKGGKVRLECITNDLGSPSDNTEYHWDADGVVFDTRTSILSISSVRLVNRANISCVAVNSVGAGARATYELTPYAPPKFINALPPSIGLSEHFSADRPSADSEGLNVYCRVECTPLCSIAWLRNGEPIDNRTGEFEITNSVIPEEFLLNRFESSVSTLTWRANSIPHGLDRVRDSGVIFSCVSSGNIVGPGVRSDTRFQVEYAPEKLRVSSSRADVIEGEQLPELRCDADALPAATYRWISDSFYDKFSGVIAEGPVLALNRSITRDSAGTYTCLAANRHGERRIDLQINVLFKPSCTIYESRTASVTSKNGDAGNVALVCEASMANPMSHLRFSWSLNGTYLNDTYIQQIAHTDDNKSRIVIPASVEELFGTWTCSVQNTVGSSDPNCTLFVDAPLFTPEWSALNDESILVISAVIVAIIFAFVFVILSTIFLMKRRRSVKNEKEKRENPDGSRSPTPSSSISRLSSTQNDLISTKSQVSSKKNGPNGGIAGSGGLCVTDTEHLSSSNSSSVLSGNGGSVVSPSGDLCFDSSTSMILPHLQRKSDLYYAQHHGGLHHSHHHHPTIGTIHQSSIHSQSPLPPPSHYDIASKTADFRRTQSARYNATQTLGNGNIYSICEDVNSGSMIYADLEMPEHDGVKVLPPVPAPKPKLTNTLANHHVYHNQHPFNYPMSGTLGRSSTMSHNGQQSHVIGSNSSNSSTPPSMSTTSTTNNSTAPSLQHNNYLVQPYHSTPSQQPLQPTYDRPDSINKPYFAQRVQTSSSSNNSTSSSSYDDRNCSRPLHSALGTTPRNTIYQMGANVGDQFVGPQSFWEGYSRRPLHAKSNLRSSERF